MGIDQAGDDDLARGVDHFGVGRQRRRGNRADGDDLALLDDEDAVVNRWSLGSVNPGAAEGDRFRRRFLGGGRLIEMDGEGRKKTQSDEKEAAHAGTPARKVVRRAWRQNRGLAETSNAPEWCSDENLLRANRPV